MIRITQICSLQSLYNIFEIHLEFFEFVELFNWIKLLNIYSLKYLNQKVIPNFLIKLYSASKTLFWYLIFEPGLSVNLNINTESNRDSFFIQETT